jgi:hypothetical protein
MWNDAGGDVLADLQAACERTEQQSRETFRPIEYSDGLQQLAEAFAARHGFAPPPRPRPRLEPRAPELAPLLRFAIESGGNRRARRAEAAQKRRRM